MTDFGAFVELEPGVDALLHVSQISRDHVDKPSDVLTVGQEIEAKVVDFNPDDKKISLSIKQMDREGKKEEGNISYSMPRKGNFIPKIRSVRHFFQVVSGRISQMQSALSSAA